jgi:diguanylate cyclase (GGDEF)-like protein
LLPETDETCAVQWGDRCRLAVAETPLMLERTTVHVTVSIGIAQRQESTLSPENLLDLTDQALLAAKKMGRNRVVAFGSLEQSDMPLEAACSDDR